jgi:alkyl sulfatase BDS1-like metallo-beta-lactamase superfamily hydrolase
MSKPDIEQLMFSLPEKFQKVRLEGMDTVIHFDFDGEGDENWILAIRDGHAEIKRGIAEKPNAVFMVGFDDFVALLSGNTEEIGWSFMQGKIVVSGNMSVLWRVLALIRGN